MAYIGFVFEIRNTKQYHVVFIESPSHKRDCIVGFLDFFKSSEITSFSYLSPSLEFLPFFYLDTTTLPYAKVSVSKKNSFYIDDLTLWLEPQKYKYMRFLLEIEGNFNEEVSKNINSLVELLNL